MSDQLRFLVTVDASNGLAIRAERVGESGDLSEVNLQSFLSTIAPGHGGGGVPQQIVINVYAGSGQTDLAASPVSFSERRSGPTPGFVPPWPPPVVAATKE